MDLAKHRIKDDGYLVLLIAVFSLPVYFFDVSNSTILGIYLVLILWEAFFPAGPDVLFCATLTRARYPCVWSDIRY